MPEFDFEAGYRRLEAAMNGGAREVPFIVQMHEFAMTNMGQPGREFYTDPEAFVRGICRTAIDYRFDTPSFIWDVYNVEAEALGLPLVLFEDMAPALDNVNPLIKTEADLAALKTPDPATAGRMPMVAEIIHLVKELTGRRPPLCFCGPFTMAAHLMTFENLIVQINRNPGFVHKVMAFIVDEVLVPYGAYMLKQFPDLPFYDGSDATASLPFITLEMQEEFAMEPILRMQRQLTLPVLVDNWWGDSYPDDKERFWENKLKVTPGYFKIQDPDLWKVGLKEPMDFARRKNKSVVLGIDNNLFQNGPAEEIEKRVHEYMEAIEEAGGKGCAYFCNLSAVTPPENVRIAVDAALAFRRGERPWRGLRRAGTPEARGDTGKVQTNEAAIIKAAAPEREDTEEDRLFDAIFDAVLDHEDKLTAELVSQGLETGVPVHSLLDDALIAAMDDVGEEFSNGTIFVPEMLMAARAMKAGLEVLRPILTQTGEPPKGLVMLATVQGDVHDIGKNLVGMMLEGAGYRVINLGVNVTPEEVLDRANELKPDVVGLSALLTTSMPAMQKTVALFKRVRSTYPVIVGGAPVTEEFASRIDADGYGENAPMAVETVHRLVAAGPRAQSAA
ncbi:MAG: cobalamin-dependent protein [Alphaproteobacteria bacterium]